jgi:DNA repair photolyase
MQQANGRKITSGTKEWADNNVNLIDGCSHDCRYCYAKKMAVRFGRKSPDTWREMVVREHDVKRGYGRRKGRIMFPTSHDIVPDEPYFTACMTVLEKLLRAKNSVLVTTKPHLKVVEHICTQFKDYRDQIQFRFTITSIDDALLSFWEPGAPKLAERLAALKHAYGSGFKTSISIEPCLDADPRALVSAVKPFVTESIWLGSMNYNGKHPSNDIPTLKKWVTWFGQEPFIRFKDSIKGKVAT